MIIKYCYYCIFIKMKKEKLQCISLTTKNDRYTKSQYKDVYCKQHISKDKKGYIYLIPIEGKVEYGYKIRYIADSSINQNET